MMASNSGVSHGSYASPAALPQQAGPGHPQMFPASGGSMPSRPQFQTQNTFPVSNTDRKVPSLPQISQIYRYFFLQVNEIVIYCL